MLKMMDGESPKLGFRSNVITYCIMITEASSTLALAVSTANCGLAAKYDASETCRLISL